jgi:hypothetical protein
MKTVYGVGIYDGNGESHSPQYTRWMSMIQRCYDPGALFRDPSYKGVEVCEDWKTFRNFRNWMNAQDWVGKCLDKDLSGGKLYSPETCFFIPEDLNKFLTGGRSKIGGLVGTNFEKDRGKWKASLSIPGQRSKTLGRYNTELEAHKAYLKAKGNILLDWAVDVEDNPLRVAMVTCGNKMIKYSEEL